jgi:hypothetical protein
MIGGQGFSGTGIGSAAGVGNGLGASRNPPLISISMLFLITFIFDLHHFLNRKSEGGTPSSLLSIDNLWIHRWCGRVNANPSLDRSFRFWRKCLVKHPCG